ncbi:MAG: cobalamin biosynthesis protein CobW [Hydrotalea sp.]|nr:cobalamin biosynthesis protein CobW [Hydrotalea sp.]
MQAKIPTTIITGFLGSGKTSLLAHVLKHSGGRRIALLINEFGSLGMDEAIVKSKCDDNCKPQEVIELANGCICCTVADDFLPAMKKILASDKKIDHIIIETSGLALPKPLLQAFQWHEIAPLVTVDGVVAVLDGPAILTGKFQDAAPSTEAQQSQKIDHENEIAELFEDQLLSADLVLLNKCDLLSPAERKQIIADLRSGKLEGLRPAAKIIETENAVVDPAVILGMAQAVENDLANRKSHHDGAGAEEHGHDEFATFIVPFGVVADEKKLEQRILSLLRDHDILRIKGMVARPGKKFLEIWQVAGPRIERYFSMTESQGEESQLVVIGLKGLDAQLIAKELQAAAL